MAQLNNEHWMREALKGAEQAFAEDQIPVGCVVVCDDAIVGRGRRRADGHIALDHAEMQALRECLGPHRRYGHDLILYSTLEPCAMCFGTIAHNRVHKVVYGLEDPDGGATQLDLQRLGRYEREFPTVVAGILSAEIKALMKQYFQVTKHPYWSTHPDNALVKFCLV